MKIMKRKAGVFLSSILPDPYGDCIQSIYSLSMRTSVLDYVLMVLQRKSFITFFFKYHL